MTRISFEKVVYQPSRVLIALTFVLGLLGNGLQGAWAASMDEVTRIANQKPIIDFSFPGVDGNINGPSLIRVPDWIPANQRANPNANYYLYFAHHTGKNIRMAWAKNIEGPYTMYSPNNGVLKLGIKVGRLEVSNHIASPDVIVDDENQRILMYFHGGDVRWNDNKRGQSTLVAVSSNGLNFNGGVKESILGKFYFRVFKHGGNLYAIAKEGFIYRAQDSHVPWANRSNVNQSNTYVWTRSNNNPFSRVGGEVRHNAVYVEGDTLHVYYSYYPDKPERIYHSTIDLSDNWNNWKATNPNTVLQPELNWEGIGHPNKWSEEGSDTNVRQLRDPAFFKDADGQMYLLYTGQGEEGIGLARFSQSAGDNQKPRVSFTKPNKSSVGSNLGVIVDASDPDGSVDHVLLYINDVLVRKEGAKPYEWGTLNSKQSDQALMNLSPGSYQLKAVAMDNAGATTSVSKTVTVAGDGASEATISLPKTTFAENESITVSYRNLPGNETDWISIYAAGARNEAFGQFFYTDGAKQGSMTFTGLVKGNYEARLFFNDSYTLEDSIAFTVTQGGGNGGGNPGNGDGDNNGGGNDNGGGNGNPDNGGGSGDGPDSDGDNIPDSIDNCPHKANPGQSDSDNDGIGNACELGSEVLPSDTVLVRPETKGPIFAPITSYRWLPGDKWPDKNYELPIYKVLNRDKEAFWNYLVDELLLARVDAVLLHGSGCKDLNSGESGHGNMCPRTLRKFVDAAEKAGATNVIKVGMWDPMAHYPADADDDRFDMSKQSDWKYFWDHNIKIFFDTIPKKMWLLMDGKPLITTWHIKDNKFKNQRGNASKLITWLKNKFKSRYGVEPVFIVQDDWFKADPTLTTEHVMGKHGWFTPSKGNIQSYLNYNGKKWGAVAAGYRKDNDGGLSVPGCGNSCREVTRKNGRTLVEALEKGKDAHFILYEAWTNMAESNGLYRSDDWAYPTQYINIARRFADPSPETLRFQAEGADRFYDTTGDNKGGDYANRALDVKSFSNGWYVGWTKKGEWIEYQDVHLAEGTYRFTARVSTNGSGKKMRLGVGGLPSVTMPNTGGSWKNVHLGEVKLNKGSHNLRLHWESDDINLDWFFLKRVTAVDDGGEPGYQAPVVSFKSPASSTNKKDLGVVVQASDPDGQVSDVMLYIDDVFVRNEGGAPYEWGTANANKGSQDTALLNLQPGTYTLRAVAIDNDGNSTTKTHTVTVQGDVGASPLLSLNKTTYTLGEAVRVNYFGSRSPLDWVGVYRNGNIGASCVANENNMSWQYAANEQGALSFTGLAAGSYQAIMLGDDGACHISNKVSFTVQSGQTDPGDNPGQIEDIKHIGTTEDYHGDAKLRLTVPGNAKNGDLLMMFMSRTDDLLPMSINGWKTAGTCYKTSNGQSQCFEVKDCTEKQGNYCRKFGSGGSGKDLATGVYYRTLTSSMNRNLAYNLATVHDSPKPGWAILSVLRGADNDNPVRSLANRSNDKDGDSLFPSVEGKKGDLLMLSMAFDDTTKRDDFKAPNGMSMYSWIAGNDEAGYVYAQKLAKNGQTGERETIGDGGPDAKDALIALTVRAAGSGSTNPPDDEHNDSGAGNPYSSASIAAGSFSAIKEGALMTNQSGYSGTGFIDMGMNGSWVEWNNVYAPVAGNYRIDIWYSNGKRGARRSAAIVNGKNLGNLSFDETGHFSNWAVQSVNAYLNQGNNRLRIQANTDIGGPHIDGFDVFYLNDTPPPPPVVTPPSGGTKIAFIGDTGAGSNFQSVLNLIKQEKADLTIVAGDTSYDSDKDDDWDAKVRNTLGAKDPALIAAGNHDYGDSKFSNVKDFGKKRLNKQTKVKCQGAYAERMTCQINNVYIVLSAIGSGGDRDSHETYIRDSLENGPANAWRICSWHKNQKEMQVGGKGSAVGWTAYENCRQNGAIIATGHEHSYSRTHLLSDMSNQNIASKASTFTVEEGKTFAFVNGLGGVGIRDQEIGGSHWAKIYTSTQNARYGVLFGTFYDDRAEFYFKNINGKIIDEFTVLKGY